MALSESPHDCGCQRKMVADRHPHFHQPITWKYQVQQKSRQILTSLKKSGMRLFQLVGDIIYCACFYCMHIFHLILILFQIKIVMSLVKLAVSLSFWPNIDSKYKKIRRIQGQSLRWLIYSAWYQIPFMYCSYLVGDVKPDSIHKLCWSVYYTTHLANVNSKEMVWHEINVCVVIVKLTHRSSLCSLHVVALRV